MHDSNFSLGALVCSLNDRQRCTPSLLGYCWAGRGSGKGKTCGENRQVGGNTRFDIFPLKESLTTGSSLLPLLPSDVLLSEAQELGEGSRFSAEGRMPRCIILFF